MTRRRQLQRKRRRRVLLIIIVVDVVRVVVAAVVAIKLTAVIFRSLHATRGAEWPHARALDALVRSMSSSVTSDLNKQTMVGAATSASPPPFRRRHRCPRPFVVSVVCVSCGACTTRTAYRFTLAHHLYINVEAKRRAQKGAFDDRTERI